jgi:hypothetical protein
MWLVQVADGGARAARKAVSLNALQTADNQQFISQQ